MDTFDFQVIIVSNKLEAKEELKEDQNILLAIVSYNLLNEDNGESVNYILSENIPTIVLVNNLGELPRPKERGFLTKAL